MFTSQRTLDWSRGAQHIRPTISREARRAHIAASAWANSAERAATKVSASLVVAGRYDRAAIMRAALAQAAARRRVTGDAWATCLSDALRGTWAVAKRLHRSRAH